MWEAIAPWFGYAASFCLVMSLIAKSDLHFRVWNLLGTIFFVLYGIILHAWPVLLTNGILMFINLVYLYKIRNRKEAFDTIDIQEGSTLLKKFLDFNRTEINQYFPNFTDETLRGTVKIATLRDMAIANIFAANVDADGVAKVVINYTTPKFRDYKVGRYLFTDNKNILLNKGIKKVVYDKVEHEGHRKFLIASGFSKRADGGYELVL